MDFTSFEHSIGFKALQASPSTADFLAKLSEDRELPDSDKELFYIHVAAYTVADGDIQGYCERWLNTAKLKGSAFSGDINGMFIRINDIPRFADWVAKIVDKNMDEIVGALTEDDFEARRDAFEVLLEAEVKYEIQDDSTLTQFYLGVPALSLSEAYVLREAKTAPWIEWSFPEPEDEDLFTEKKIKDLDCRAGLLPTTEIRLVYRHAAKFCRTITKPTVFDAVFYAPFRPGGKTIPLSSCAGQTGFDEYVHLPNKFKHISGIPYLIN